MLVPLLDEPPPVALGGPRRCLRRLRRLGTRCLCPGCCRLQLLDLLRSDPAEVKEEEEAEEAEEAEEEAEEAEEAEVCEHACSISACSA